MSSRRQASLLGESLRMPSSLWSATAIAGPTLKPLERSETADVIIVGAGYTGLSAAIHLAEAGLSCVVLDAAEPGWGASGRNNGQVIAGLKQDPEVIERLYPGEQGRKLVQFGSEAPTQVWELIKRHGIDCAANHRGWIQPAFTRTGFATVKARCEAWRQRGIHTRMLEGNELHILLGTNQYSLGWLDPRGGSVQPLSYARGLAQVAINLGVKIYAPSKVESLRSKDDQWIAETGQARVTGKHVLVATGAYAERLVPKLRTSFVPVRTAQVATRPLPDAMRKVILPKGHVSSDTRQLLTSFRLSPDGRLVMGGSGATAGLDHSAIVPYLHKAGEELFGHLGRLEWDFQWSGYFAVTTDHLPHVHEPERNLHISVGCNGRGIAVSTSLGIQLAKRILGMAAAELPVPVSSIGTVKFHVFRGLGVKAATVCKRLQDYLG
ncbi:FAD-binding oxidoreductase [Pseudomonas sp. R5(2019)]|uniref:NAD(P)/FAD-dependent oxidoreductase n=1 Tax=Pseudomonas sp. R5(2019) TaxID=2697566 RepID=UPI001411D2AC|nr:FAD-binding oxidoreductase [Pseudomonas sp. R5(2019)]NBA96561.1 FAD-dependent oxidoreductase [Pseudomonas sp. R5(2019)]